MKKFIFFLVASVFLFPSFFVGNSKVQAEENKTISYPNVAEISLMNKALDEMVIEANQKLENGETTFIITEQVGKEKLELGFSSADILNFNSKSLLTEEVKSLSGTRKKTYKAYVKNTSGFDFSHTLSGEFVYGSGKLHGATKSASLSGSMYGKSHQTWIDKLDQSVWAVHSNGTFKALNVFVEYKTYITVKLLGSGDYRIEKARISA